MTSPEDVSAELAPRGDNLPTPVGSELEPSWLSPANALQVRLSGAYLGRVGNGRFRDKHKEAVPDIGAAVIVSQSSFGGTYLSASALDGYTVEALNPDASSTRSMWVGPNSYDDEVSLDRDSGNMGTPEYKALWTRMDADWSRNVEGNPGVRSGLIRVTDTSGTKRHYLVEADFRGQADGWNVSGDVTEVWPNEKLQLAMEQRQLPAGTVLDPSLISAELAATIPVTSQTISDLRTAFIHDTPDVHTLYAPQHSAEAAKTYSDLTLGLLHEVAKQRPDILDGSEFEIDELGRRARLLDYGRGDDGFLTSLGSDHENRVAYLESISDLLEYHSATSDNGSNYRFFAFQAFEILEMSFAHGAQFNLSTDSTIAAQLQGLIEADKRRTAEEQALRAEILHDTIMNPGWRWQGVEYRAAIPGKKIEIDLSHPAPLLTDEQTYEAFYKTSEEFDRDAEKVGFHDPAIAMLEISGSRFIILDARNARTTDVRDECDFKLLQIASWQVHPEYGLPVVSTQLRFTGDFSDPIQIIKDRIKPAESGYLSENDTNVTMEYDKASQRLIIVTPYRKVGITAKSDAFEVVPTGPEDTGDLEYRNAVRSWQDAVRSVKRETAALRTSLESELQAQVQSGHLTADAAERRAHEIEQIIARGPARSRTYNGWRGDKWHRAQSYYVSIDKNGNIVGDFESGRYEVGITGQPVSPGRHIIHRNPIQ